MNVYLDLQTGRGMFLVTFVEVCGCQSFIYYHSTTEQNLSGDTCLKTCELRRQPRYLLRQRLSLGSFVGRLESGRPKRPVRLVKRAFQLGSAGIIVPLGRRQLVLPGSLQSFQRLRSIRLGLLLCLLLRNVCLLQRLLQRLHALLTFGQPRHGRYLCLLQSFFPTA